MLTLPADLTQSKDWASHRQLRELDAEIHKALHPEDKIEWNHERTPVTRYPSPPYWLPLPRYTIPGPANNELAEAMLQSQQRIEIWLDPAPDWARVDGIVIGGPQVWPNVRLGRSVGIAPTLPLAIVAAYCDWQGIKILEGQ